MQGGRAGLLSAGCGRRRQVPVWRAGGGLVCTGGGAGLLGPSIGGRGRTPGFHYWGRGCEFHSCPAPRGPSLRSYLQQEGSRRTGHGRAPPLQRLTRACALVSVYHPRVTVPVSLQSVQGRRASVRANRSAKILPPLAPPCVASRYPNSRPNRGASSTPPSPPASQSPRAPR